VGGAHRRAAGQLDDVEAAEVSTPVYATTVSSASGSTGNSAPWGGVGSILLAQPHLQTGRT
jgi:hypothetical protein